VPKHHNGMHAVLQRAVFTLRVSPRLSAAASSSSSAAASPSQHHHPKLRVGLNSTSARGTRLASSAAPAAPAAAAPMEVYQFPCLQNNYAFLLHDPASGATAVAGAHTRSAVSSA
jgi:hypothetical protein